VASLAERRAKLRALAGQHMVTDGAHDLAHLDRVWTNAQHIAAHEPPTDATVLICASYQHDLVNLPKDAPDRHLASRKSAHAAEPLLRDLNLTQSQIEATQHAIEAHSFSAKIPPRTLEAKILRDADRLDALGAIGIARTFMVSGALNRPLYDANDPFCTTRTPDDNAYALDHWPQKLLRLSQEMQTKTGQKLAQHRLKTMQSFIKQLAQELDLPAPDHWY
jgi:uncharacterized protein